MEQDRPSFLKAEGHRRRFVSASFVVTHCFATRFKSPLVRMVGDLGRFHR
jgi:hypothetical protein